MYITGFIGFIALSSIAIVANYKLQHLPRLPMQWSLSGRVNWTAPRLIALAFFPALFATVSTLLIASGVSGHEAATTQSVVVLAIIIAGAQLLHLLMIDKKSRY